jgi:rhodanese-related sulfurtransferase
MMRFTDLFSQVKTVQASQTKQMMVEKPSGSYTLLDVREPEEYEQGHIPGSVLIPLSQLPARMQEIDRNKPLVAY